MSAFMQSKAHVDAIIRLALEGPATLHGHDAVRWDRSWYFYHEGQSHYVNADTADALGMALVTENAASVNYRYREDDNVAEPYFYALGRRLTLAEGFNALDGFEYQACEHPGWNTSLARTFIDALRSHLWRTLPGYESAGTWAI